MPQNVTIKRFYDAMFVSWDELSAVQSRGFAIYVVRYHLTDVASSSNTFTTSNNYAVIENLSPNNDYSVSVAAAVRDGQEILMGPPSESIKVTASSKFKDFKT